MLTSKCLYVHDGHLALSCCRLCFAMMVRRNGEATRYQEESFEYYGWPDVEAERAANKEMRDWIMEADWEHSKYPIPIVRPKFSIKSK